MPKRRGLAYSLADLAAEYTLTIEPSKEVRCPWCFVINIVQIGDLQARRGDTISTKMACRHCAKAVLCLVTENGGQISVIVQRWPGGGI